jgi:hypothetical protein
MPVQPQRKREARLILSRPSWTKLSPKARLPGKRHLTNARGRPGLADREQANIGGVTSVLPRRAGDSRENGLQLGGE